MKHSTQSMRARQYDQPLVVLPDVTHEPHHADSIAGSHERCLAFGLEPSRVPDLSPIAPQRLQEARDRQRRLCDHAAPVMELLYEQIVSTHSMVVLTDANGTIVQAVGDNSFMERAQQVALAPGVNWAEQTKGTNGMGTALFNECATLVHAGEHFLRSNRFLTCSAAPIFDHHGQMMGVLDVSGDQRSYHPHTLGLVSLSARMIENHWFTDRFRHGLRLHFHHRVDWIGTMREGMLAVSADGEILGANRTALALLGTHAAGLRQRGLEGALGVTVGDVVAHCRRNADAPILLCAPLPEPLYARAFLSLPTLWPLRRVDGRPSEPVAGTAALACGEAPAASEEPAQASGAEHVAARLADVEDEAIQRAVETAHGNISKAARALGIGRNTVYRKLRRRRAAPA